MLGRGISRSYQWDVQPAVLRVAASMRTRRFKVWVDTEMMSGSTLDAMAAAVEDAYCILICITDRYKARAPRRRGRGARCPSSARLVCSITPKSRCSTVHRAVACRARSLSRGFCAQTSANCRLEGMCE